MPLMLPGVYIFLTTTFLFLITILLSIDINKKKKKLALHWNFQSTTFFTIFRSLQIFMNDIKEILAFAPYSMWEINPFAFNDATQIGLHEWESTGDSLSAPT